MIFDGAFFDRDLSWLGFNGRVLSEAAANGVPLGERMRFAAIYSSNLDEFYRVRMPVMMALKKIGKKEDIPDLPAPEPGTLKAARAIIQEQLELFGVILKDLIIPSLREQQVELIYNKPIPPQILEEAKTFFFDHLSAYLEISFMDKEPVFFPKNNELYLAVEFHKNGSNGLAFVSIPSAQISRFFCVKNEDISYVLFIDDIIRHFLPVLFPGYILIGNYAFKVTRDAELDLQDEYDGDIAEKIEKQISKRDFGLATRFLFQPGIPEETLASLVAYMSLRKANQMEGGYYHNLKDFFQFPITRPSWDYPRLLRLQSSLVMLKDGLLDEIKRHDVLINTPYESYDTVLRFFNLAAIDPDVVEVYATMYRIAHDSQIAHALMTAAKNGKLVTVFVELKARFDEANNIHWAKLMKEAGVNIIYSIPNLKVHAKVALLKKIQGNQAQLFGLFSTGNLNEKTALQYTDHIVLTAHATMLQELANLFDFLKLRRHPLPDDKLTFQQLLVAQFNLADTFLSLIDQEIAHVKDGRPGGIIIKLNNLEEERLITKLYEASQAGVKIQLIIRSICRLRPGIAGLSENITVKRIVDRFLEHGRVFIFHNAGMEKYFMGSADWMNRNIYNRIEVCFPVYDEKLQQRISKMIDLQLADDVAAGIHSQLAIYNYLAN
ncbi:polyphosphate kinase [bacterium A37T11]|nr:polyphosphate kinase [bacterium A37T11]